MAQTTPTLTPAETALPVDLVRLADWMDSQGLGGGPITDARLLAGGTQNILLRFHRGGRDFIFRHPPPNPRPQSNKVMEREARLLGALAGTRVPHPALIAACTDLSVLGAVFYLMEPVDGFNPTIGLPPVVRDDPAVRHRMGLSIVDALAELALVDINAAGLQDFGKLDGFLERQVGRWAGELESYARFQGWSGPAPLGNVAAVGDWLAAHLPSTMQPGIIHGDYHVGNVIYAESG